MPTRSPRRRARHRAERRPGSRRGLLAVGVALVAVLAAAAFALAARPERAGPAGAPAATPAAEALLDWADRELPPGTRLRAEGEVRDDLLAAGASEDQVATDRPPGPDELVLAVTDGSTGPGGQVVARIDGLVVVDPSPGTPAAEQLDRRRTLAGAVLANPTTRAPEDAAAVLRSADVDMRLLSLLAVLTAREGLGMAAFPRDEGAEGPARRVLIDSVGNAPVGAGEAATDELLTWLEAQLPPYAPDRIEATDDSVLLSYRYAPDPDALVSDAFP